MYTHFCKNKLETDTVEDECSIMPQRATDPKGGSELRACTVARDVATLRVHAKR